MKIIFAGLDKSGKSTVIYALKNRFSLIKPRPTLGVEQQFIKETQWMGFNLSIVDLGGQTTLRKNHLNNPTAWTKVSAMFYLIDIQDHARFDDSLDYLKSISEKFVQNGEKPRILVCFNKLDPPIREAPDMLNTIATLTEKIKNMAGSQNLSFCNTSIYDPATLSRVFYDGILKDLPKAPIITKFLREYADLTYSSAVVLLDENLLTIGTKANDQRYVDICEAISSWLVIATDKVKRYEIKMGAISGNLMIPLQNNTKGGEQAGNFVFHKFQTPQKMEFTLIALSVHRDTPSLSERHLPSLIKQLGELVDAKDLETKTN